MGRVAGSYGVRGWVKAIPGGGAAQGLADAKEWWIGGKPFKAVARIHGSTVVAALSGIGSREEALKLRGEPVSVRRETLVDPGEGHYYHADLIGLEVVNEQGQALGKVKRMFSNGAQDVMELSGEKERLLPWVPAVVKQVDLQKKQVTVEWGADW
ncbi:MAG: ribosome maturation factor RimM [Clostridia bacterium]